MHKLLRTFLYEKYYYLVFKTIKHKIFEKVKKNM
uniref:Uncharacterized protein n=1 Tax=Strongyloides stercoralis TaxID=6248 RepID=A0A0K0ERW4_STRER